MKRRKDKDDIRLHIVQNLSQTQDVETECRQFLKMQGCYRGNLKRLSRTNTSGHQPIHYHPTRYASRTNTQFKYFF